jgi:hypothetical protein
MALCIMLATSGCSAIIEAQTRNAFDEMYLSIKHPKESDTWFGYMEPIGRRLTMDIDDENFYMGHYRSSLGEGEGISIYVYLRDARVVISCTKEVADSRRISLGYRYDFASKTLTIRPVSLSTRNYIEMGVERSIDDGGQLAAYFAEQGVTREDIERYRDYFLYDKVLTDWVTGNGERSRFSPGDFRDPKAHATYPVAASCRCLLLRVRGPSPPSARCCMCHQGQA